MKHLKTFLYGVLLVLSALMIVGPIVYYVHKEPTSCEKTITLTPVEETTFYCPYQPCEMVEEWVPELDRYITYCLVSDTTDLTLTTGEDDEPK